MENNQILELTAPEMVQFLKYMRDNVIVNVILYEEGGDESDGGEEIQTGSGQREA